MSVFAVCRSCNQRFPTYDAVAAPICGMCQPRDIGINWAAVGHGKTDAWLREHRRHLEEEALRGRQDLTGGGA